MVTVYSIVQYMPDVVRGERINIGVVAIADSTNEVRARFVHNWQRISAFDSGEDLDGSPRRPVVGLQKLQRVIASMKADELRKAFGDWQQSVRFSPPVPSIRKIDDLVEHAAERFLIDPPKRETYRSRHQVTTSATRAVKQALRDEIGSKTKQLVHNSYLIEGLVDEHRFDLAVANGEPYLAAASLSFEAPMSKRLDDAVKLAEFAVSDVRYAMPELSAAVIIAPPRRGAAREKRSLFTRTAKRLEKAGIEPVIERELDAWATREARLIAEKYSPSKA